jgi:hypothetical protein
MGGKGSCKKASAAGTPHRTGTVQLPLDVRRTCCVRSGRCRGPRACRCCSSEHAKRLTDDADGRADGVGRDHGRYGGELSGFGGDGARSLAPAGELELSAGDEGGGEEMRWLEPGRIGGGGNERAELLPSLSLGSW